MKFLFFIAKSDMALLWHAAVLAAVRVAFQNFRLRKSCEQQGKKLQLRVCCKFVTRMRHTKNTPYYYCCNFAVIILQQNTKQYFTPFFY